MCRRCLSSLCRRALPYLLRLQWSILFVLPWAHLQMAHRLCRACLEHRIGDLLPPEQTNTAKAGRRREQERRLAQ